MLLGTKTVFRKILTTGIGRTAFSLKLSAMGSSVSSKSVVTEIVPVTEEGHRCLRVFLCICLLTLSCIILLVLLLFAFVYPHLSFSSQAGNENWKTASSIYDFNALDIDGNNVSLEKYRGHVAIIVNVASK